MMAAWLTWPSMPHHCCTWFGHNPQYIQRSWWIRQHASQLCFENQHVWGIQVCSWMICIAMFSACCLGAWCWFFSLLWSHFDSIFYLLWLLISNVEANIVSQTWNHIRINQLISLLTPCNPQLLIESELFKKSSISLFSSCYSCVGSTVTFCVELYTSLGFHFLHL